MIFKSKRGQLSIEMVILVLAILLSGTIFATYMTKNTGSSDEISNVKKTTFEGAVSTQITTSKTSGSFFPSGAPDDEEPAEDEEETTDEDEEDDPSLGMKIIPGNGDSVEFRIFCNNSNEETIYFLNNGKGYGTSALYADVEHGFVGLSDKIFHNGSLVPINSYDSFEGYATYIYFKTKGNTEYELEAIDIEDPIPFKIVNNGGFGQFYITILDSEKAQEVSDEEESEINSSFFN
uniref:Class III signal peptide n=1 Tax=Methanococcus maripaludis (strain C6 / ATCC BAA-1332) TaxID=444158 RepID=A9A6C4_METM6